MSLNLVISHRGDFDGLASASLLIRRTLREGSPFILSLKNYEDVEKIIESRFLELENSTIMILDLPLRFGAEEEYEKLSILSRKNNKIIWIDHHPADEKEINIIRNVAEVYVDSSKPSATRMVYEYLELKGDKVASRIAEIADQIDSWNFSEEMSYSIMELVAFLKYLDNGHRLYPFLNSFVMYLAGLEGEFKLTEFYTKMIDEYRILKKKAIEIVRETFHLIAVGDYKIGVAWAPRILTGSIAGEYLLQQENLDYIIIVSENGGGSVRRGREDLDCRIIAEVFGGGGHPYASGMRLSEKPISRREYEYIARMIGTKLRDKFGGGSNE